MYGIRKSSLLSVIWKGDKKRQVNLLLDIGNTLIKAGFAEHGKIKESIFFPADEQGKIKRILYSDTFDAAIIASSGKLSSDILDNLYREVKYVLELNHLTRIPVKNEYETPHTLGKDRLAAAVGANFLYPEAEILIIDLGTAITYEYMAAGRYLGGNISPGMSTRFASLHQMTDKLPHLSAQKDFQSPGKNTHQAILSGVIQGILFELNAYILHFLADYPSGIILFTGGDSNFFAEKINSPIFVHPDLVLLGLNHILEYNR